MAFLCTYTNPPHIFNTFYELFTSSPKFTLRTLEQNSENLGGQTYMQSWNGCATLPNRCLDNIDEYVCWRPSVFFSTRNKSVEEKTIDTVDDQLASRVLA